MTCLERLHVRNSTTAQHSSNATPMCEITWTSCMTHGWVVVHTHSTPVPDRGEEVVGSLNLSPTSTQRSTCPAHLSHGSGAEFRTTNVNASLAPYPFLTDVQVWRSLAIAPDRKTQVTPLTCSGGSVEPKKPKRLHSERNETSGMSVTR